MSKNNTPQSSYCWDTSVILAWLNEESTAPLGAIELLLRHVHDGEATLVLSVMTYQEILRAKHTQKQIDAFSGFLKRSNIVCADHTFHIAQKAEEIRSRGISLATSQYQQRNIKAADATILATGIVYEVDVFHTLDDRLLTLNGSPIVDGLQISKPRDQSGQLSLL